MCKAAKQSNIVRDLPQEKMYMYIVPLCLHVGSVNLGNVCARQRNKAILLEIYGNRRCTSYHCVCMQDQ